MVKFAYSILVLLSIAWWSSSAEGLLEPQATSDDHLADLPMDLLLVKLTQLAKAASEVDIQKNGQLRGAVDNVMREANVLVHKYRRLMQTKEESTVQVKNLIRSIELQKKVLVEAEEELKMAFKGRQLPYSLEDVNAIRAAMRVPQSQIFIKKPSKKTRFIKGIARIGGIVGLALVASSLAKPRPADLPMIIPEAPLQPQTPTRARWLSGIYIVICLQILFCICYLMWILYEKCFEEDFTTRQGLTMEYSERVKRMVKRTILTASSTEKNSSSAQSERASISERSRLRTDKSLTVPPWETTTTSDSAKQKKSSSTSSNSCRIRRIKKTWPSEVESSKGQVSKKSPELKSNTSISEGSRLRKVKKVWPSSESTSDSPKATSKRSHKKSTSSTSSSSRIRSIKNVRPKTNETFKMAMPSSPPVDKASTSQHQADSVSSSVAPPVPPKETAMASAPAAVTTETTLEKTEPMPIT